MRRLIPAVGAFALAWHAAALGLEGRLSGPGLAGFHTPFDFAPAAEGGVAVLEDLEGTVRLAGPGGRGSALPGLLAPRLLASDETGLLLVLDGSTTVSAYRKGREAWKTKLKGDPRPTRPGGMAARNGILWIADRTSPRLFLYAYDGKGLAVADVGPWARSLFSVALGPSGEAFATDPLGPAVLSLSPAGSFLAAWNLAGTGVTRPTGIAVDPAGRVWVSDGVTGTVVCLDARGAPIQARVAGKPPRFQDPLRLGWASEHLWVLEGRTGRALRIHWEEP